MSAKTGRFTSDPIPNVKTAGKVVAMGHEGADHCIRADVHQKDQNPGTPEHIKKYRKSLQNQPGVKQVHPGMYQDKPKVQEGFAYGKKTYGSDHVDGVIKAQNLAGLADKFNDIKEGKYASKSKEPLGMGYQRGYKWPA